MDEEIFIKAIKILEKDTLIPCKITMEGEVKRSSPSEFYPIGNLGISIKLENKLFGNKNVFLTYSFCDVLFVYGNHLASEFLRKVYEDEWNEFLAKHSGLIS